MTTPAPRPSILQQLLHEISWEGKRVSLYRQGGLGLENVLTAEVLQGLDFLPRRHFLGAVVEALAGGSDEARNGLIECIEDATVSFLPGQFFLRPATTTHQSIAVNPDGIIRTDRTLAFIEAKRPRSGSFQIEQLARNLVVVAREAKDRLPLLILILGHEPPIAVKGMGQVPIRKAIMAKLEGVLRKADSPQTLNQLESMLDSCVAWITWDSIARVVSQQADSFRAESISMQATVARLAGSVVGAIERHK